MSTSAATVQIPRDRHLLLRNALRLDAGASALMGVGLLAASTPLSRLLQLPSALLFGVGVVLVGYGLALLWLQRQRPIPRTAAWAVVAVNAAWVAASIGLLFTGWVEPNTLGKAFVIAQAAAVLLFAELQFFGLQRLH